MYQKAHSSLRREFHAAPQQAAGLHIVPSAMVDRVAIHELLVTCGLSTKDVLHERAIYWVGVETVAYDIAGVCGLEICSDAALLRSVAVDSSRRNHGLAQALVSTATAEAKARGILDLYLFSKDTGSYFEKLGWCAVEVSRVASALLDAPQVIHYDKNGWYPDECAFSLDLRSTNRCQK